MDQRLIQEPEGQGDTFDEEHHGNEYDDTVLTPSNLPSQPDFRRVKLGAAILAVVLFGLLIFAPGYHHKPGPDTEGIEQPEPSSGW